MAVLLCAQLLQLEGRLICRQADALPARPARSGHSHRQRELGPRIGIPVRAFVLVG